MKSYYTQEIGVVYMLINFFVNCMIKTMKERKMKKKNNKMMTS